jgi:hypothetical protein
LWGNFGMADNDNPQLSLGGIIANLPAVRAAKKANLASRVHRRLIEPIETDQDNEQRLSFQHTVFCQAGSVSFGLRPSLTPRAFARSPPSAVRPDQLFLELSQPA